MTVGEWSNALREPTTMRAKMGPGCESSRPLPASGQEADLRCGCGRLLARLVLGAVELKCRRCKRTWRIPLETG